MALLHEICVEWRKATHQNCLEFYLLPPFLIFYLHMVLKETCTHFMCMYLLGASWYYVNWQLGCIGCNCLSQLLGNERK